MASPVGRTGTVTIRVRGGNRPGEVLLRVAGMPEHFVAYAEEPLQVGERVLVVEERGARQLDVVRWLIPGPADPGAGP